MSSSRLFRRWPAWVAVAIAAGPAAAEAADVAALKVLHSFNSPGAGYPNTELIVGSDGKLHGTTTYTSCCGGGFAFRMTPSGHVTVLHQFTGREGSMPSGPIQAQDGHYYGTTRWDGKHIQGTAYRMSPRGDVEVLHNFPAETGDCTNPGAKLIEASDGYFYGTASSGGAHDQGCVFKMSRSGKISIVHSFTHDGVDGYSPEAGLIQASDGTLYGTTTNSYLDGTVFKIATDGSYAIVHSFVFALGEPEGPVSPLLETASGDFYGTTRYGGPDGLGTVYRMRPNGDLTLVHVFAKDGVDGGYPAGALLLGRDGYIYGVTKYGGKLGQGTVYRISPDGTYSQLRYFSAWAHGGGYQPDSGLVELADGEFYGTTYAGGEFGYGTVYRVRLK